MRFRRFAPASFLLSSLALLACSSTPDGSSAAADDAFTSNDARILDFVFSAEVVAPPGADARAVIVSQLMYAQGILTTARNGNAHVGNVQLTNVAEVTKGEDRVVTYTASLPVAWPKRLATPSTYELPLPRDATRFEAFNATYDGRCGRNEYGQESFWHDWNPKAAGCTFADADVSRGVAAVAPHAGETQEKYPEYDQMWNDDRLDVVAIFGIIEADRPYDWGYMEAQTFTENARRRLTGASLAEHPRTASVLKDVTITGKVTVGGRERDVKVDVLVVNELQHVGADFDERYDALSEKADLLLYNGHAGLGRNVNALARKGKVAAGKYQLFLMNGCQTFAYLDTTMADRRRAANGESDPSGTRYLDVMSNALPGYSNNLASMSNKLVDAALQADTPKHYNDLMRGMPENHIVVVFGEEDNAFQPQPQP